MSLTFRTNLGRPLTWGELDSNFSYLNISPWVFQGYQQGQFVLYTTSGETALYYCNQTHTTYPYTLNGNNFTTQYYNGVSEVTIWTQIGGSGGAYYSANSLTGSTTGVTNVYAGESQNTFHFKSLKSLTSDIIITNDNGTIYFNSPTSVPFSKTITTVNPTCYNGSNGNITINVNGGSGSYKYSKDGGSTWTAYSTSTTKVYTGLTANTYNIQIQDTGSSFASQSVTLTQPIKLGFAFGSATATNVTVSGMTNGTITVTATGGTSPYEYKLNSGSWTQPQTGSHTYTGLTTGVYNVYIQDTNGCTPPTYSTVTIGYTNPRMILLSGVGINPTCHNGTGSIVVVVSGGSGSYQYSIDGGSYGSTTTSTTQTYSGLSAGSTHYVQIKDVITTQVISTSSITLTNPSPMSVVTSGITNVSCGSGRANIYFKVQNAVGTPQILFTNSGYPTTWYNMTPTTPSGTYYLNTSGTTLNTYFNSPGTYGGILKYKDSTCTTISGSTAYTIYYYSAVSATATLSLAPSCPGDGWQYTLNLSGGSGSWDYSLNNFSTITTTSSTSVTVSVPANTTGVTATTQTIYVRDTNNHSCIHTLTVNNSRISTLSISTPYNNPSCSSGTGIITGVTTGGRVDISNTYDYQLINITTNTTGSTVSATGSYVFTSLTPDTYKIRVRLHSTSCSYVTSGNITISPAVPVFAAFYSSTNPTTCSSGNGSIVITVSGGSGQYQYSINGSSYNGTNITPTGGKITISSLTAGSYQILFKDSNGCLMANQPYVGYGGNIVLSSSTSPGFSTHTYTLPTCYGSNATITLTATGGTAPYKFATGSTATYTYAPSSGNTITYSVTPFTTTKQYYVKDVNGCVKSVNITGGGTVALMTASLTASGTTLFLNVTNGTSPYKVYLYSGSTLVSTTSSVSSFPYNLGTYGNGNYYAVVNSNNGLSSYCTATTSTVTITAPYMLYYFRYAFDGTDSVFIETTSSNYYNISTSSNVYYNVSTSSTVTLSQILSNSISNLSSLGGGSVNLTTTAPTGWGTSNVVTMNFTTVPYIDALAIAVPNISTYSSLTTGTHLIDLSNGIRFNAMGGLIGSATVGGVSYTLYNIFTATQSGSTVKTITIS